MAKVTLCDEGRTLCDRREFESHLAALGILHERWHSERALPPDAPADAVLEAYGPEIDRLKARGGYRAADVIDVGPSTPGLDAMLARFSREHWHADDEVRFILDGRGVFHIRSTTGTVIGIEVEPGDLISVPAGTWHWFDLCAERRIRAIRLFQDPAGWAPSYTDSGAEARYEPLCLGRDDIAPRPGL